MVYDDIDKLEEWTEDQRPTLMKPQKLHYLNNVIKVISHSFSIPAQKTLSHGPSSSHFTLQTVVVPDWRNESGTSIISVDEMWTTWFENVVKHGEGLDDGAYIETVFQWVKETADVGPQHAKKPKCATETEMQDIEHVGSSFRMTNF